VLRESISLSHGGDGVDDGVGHATDGVHRTLDGSDCVLDSITSVADELLGRRNETFDSLPGGKRGLDEVELVDDRGDDGTEDGTTHDDHARCAEEPGDEAGERDTEGHAHKPTVLGLGDETVDGLAVPDDGDLECRYDKREEDDGGHHDCSAFFLASARAKTVAV